MNSLSNVVLVTACALLFAACSHTSDAPVANDAPSPAAPDAAAPAPVDDGGAPSAAPDSQSELAVFQDFTRLAADGTAVKFLLATEVEKLPAPLDTPCTFQNTERFPYHLQFLQTLPGLETLSNPTYESWALHRETRRFHAGVLELSLTSVHPGTSKSGVLGYTVYAAQVPGELLSVDEIVAIDQVLRDCTGSLANMLLYVPATSADLALARAEATALGEAGVVFAGRDELRPDGDVEVYSTGEAYGYLRRLSADAALELAGPRDVVVTETAPGDLGLVAALVTRSAQSSVSHLNLRLQEKGIPNVRAPKFFGSALGDELEGELVHLRVTRDEFSIEPATREDAEAHWAAQRGEPQSPEGDTSVDAIRPLTALRHTDALSFGVKAANLGELARALPDENHPAGIALPFAAYLEHLRHNGLEQSVATTIAEASTGGTHARDALDELRDAIRDAPIAPSWERRLYDAVERQWGEAGFTTRLRFRSSTNVEDLPGLSGAGLYESVSGCIADDLDADEEGPSLCLTEGQRAIYEAELERRQTEFEAHPDRAHLPAMIEDLEDELVKEKSARRALRKVWASLWSERAFEDRQYHAIVHDAAYMGVAVHPSLVGERLEAVAITGLDSGGELPMTRVASQLGEVGVARPDDPTAIAELLSFERSPEDTPVNVQLLQASSLVEPGTTLWPEERLTELARLLFRVQDHFADEVYPDITPLELDVEVDVDVNGNIIVKQARPYVGPGP